MAHDLYRQGLLELLAAVMKEYPQATEKEHHDELWTRVAEIQSYYATLYDNWFAANYPLMETVQQGPHDVTVKRKVRAAPQRDSAHRATRQTEVMAVVADWALSKQVLSTKKFLEDSSAHDVRCESDYFEAVARTVAKEGGANAHVGKHLEEGDLRNIRSRYFDADSDKPSGPQASAKATERARV